MYNSDTPLDGMLLHSNTMCSIRYIKQEESHGNQANGEGHEEEEKDTLT
jgi:hypothetical protein